MSVEAERFVGGRRYASTRGKDVPEASPSSVFQLLSLQDGSPVSTDKAAHTPLLTPEGDTAFKPRRGSRLGVALLTPEADTLSALPGVTSPGVSAYLAQQCRRGARRIQQQATSSRLAPPPEGRPGAAHGLPRSRSVSHLSGQTQPQPARKSRDANQVPEPTFCVTPPRSQKLPPQRTNGTVQPGAHGSPIRFNRVRPALSRSSLDRGDSNSLSGSGSGSFSRTSSLNDAKVSSHSSHPQTYLKHVCPCWVLSIICLRVKCSLSLIHFKTLNTS